MRRIFDDEPDEPFAELPAIAIDGPKAVGKTTTGEQRVRSLLRLDTQAGREAVEADPTDVLHTTPSCAANSARTCTAAS